MEVAKILVVVVGERRIAVPFVVVALVTLVAWGVVVALVVALVVTLVDLGELTSPGVLGYKPHPSRVQTTEVRVC